MAMRPKVRIFFPLSHVGHIRGTKIFSVTFADPSHTGDPSGVNIYIYISNITCGPESMMMLSTLSFGHYSPARDTHHSDENNCHSLQLQTTESFCAELLAAKRAKQL
jgi:hypothetical protein